MDSTKQLIISVLIILAIILCGAWGFMVIEGWNFLDALFMSVITLTTVGFGEVHELSSIGRIYTILLIFVGVGFLGYSAHGYQLPGSGPDV